MRIFGLITLCFFISLCNKCNKNEDDKNSKLIPIIFKGEAFGTSFSITINQLGKKQKISNKELGSQIQKKLNDIDKIFSNWKKDSEISKFNQHHSKKPFPVSGEFISVLKNAKRVHDLSQGAFDPARAELFERWGFGSSGSSRSLTNTASQEKPQELNKTKKFLLPKSKEIQDILKRSGMHLLQIQEQKFQLKKRHPKLKLNLSASAKGYGVDEIAKLLQDNGFHSFLVEIGGEIIVGKRKLNGALWQLAIEKPAYLTTHIKKNAKMLRTNKIERQMYGIVALEKKAMASSGNYRNYRNYRSYFVNNTEYNKKTKKTKYYSHIIDPRTGSSVASNIVATTVVGPSCMMADALATTLMVLNLKSGLKLIESLDNYEALWIISPNKNNRVSRKKYKTQLSSKMQVDLLD